MAVGGQAMGRSRMGDELGTETAVRMAMLGQQEEWNSGHGTANPCTEYDVLKRCTKQDGRRVAGQLTL